MTGNSDLLVAKYGALTGVAESHVAAPRPVSRRTHHHCRAGLRPVGSEFGPLRHQALRPDRPDQAAGLLRHSDQGRSPAVRLRTPGRHVLREGGCAERRRLLPEAGAGKVDEGLQVVPIPGLGPWRRRRSHPAPAQEQTELKPLTSGENRVK